MVREKKKGGVPGSVRSKIDRLLAENDNDFDILLGLKPRKDGTYYKFYSDFKDAILIMKDEKQRDGSKVDLELK